MNCITVKGIRTYSYHGCLSEETTIGGYYEVDIELYCDFKSSALKDDLSLTINYVDANKIVEEEMSKPSKLIETVAYRILERFRQSFSVLQKARIEIKKINPPIDGDTRYVSVIIEE
jgi:7,8-dihydroneopterin aldolase/epimerase/oxygenase